MATVTICIATKSITDLSISTVSSVVRSNAQNLPINIRHATLPAVSFGPFAAQLELRWLSILHHKIEINFFAFMNAFPVSSIAILSIYPGITPTYLLHRENYQIHLKNQKRGETFCK